MKRLALARDLRGQIEAEAVAAFPRECCGLIEGTRDGDEVRALALHPSLNLAPESDRFAIDPALHIALLRRLRGTDRAIIGCYHSHPNGRPEPSPRDRETMASDGSVWLIAALEGSAVTLRGFACPPGEGGVISPVPLAPIV
jgi:proteasome lid subunit RPN8/RPN11